MTSPVCLALRAAGMPEQILVLELEYYRDVTYLPERVGAVEFVNDGRFAIFGMAAVLGGGNSSTREAFVTRPVDLLVELRRVYGTRLDGLTVVLSEGTHAAYVLNRRLGLCPQNLISTRFLRQATGRHAVRMPEPPATVSTRFPSPAQVDRLGRDLLARARATLAEGQDLLARLSWPEVELKVIDHTIRLFSERSITLDVPRSEALLERVEEADRQALALVGSSNFAEALGATLARTGRSLPMKASRNGVIPALAKTDAAMIELTTDEDPDVAAIAIAATGHGSLSPTRVRLRRMLSVARAHGGSIPVGLTYHGAHTGRFSAEGAINFQNMPSRVDGPAALVRGLLVARPGHTFVIADAAQIEARVLAWFAGEMPLIDGFVSGKDIYSEFASSAVFKGEEVRRPHPDDPPELARRLKARRDVGKEAILGLGYGMGARTFMRQLMAKPACAALFKTGELTGAKVAQLVAEYRRRYTAITATWRSLELAFRSTTRGTPAIPFDRDGEDLLAKLPSNRVIRYPKSRIVRGGVQRITRLDSDGIERVSIALEDKILVYGADERIYGGKLTENLIQAIARDVLVLAILRLEALGYPVLLHVHDEILLEVTIEQAQEAREAVVRELSRDPGWDLGRGALPLAAEARIASTYGK